jgi:1,4-alpha-glucan branching enzyme
MTTSSKSKPDTPVVSPEPAEVPSRLTGHDEYLFNEGTHFRLYDKLGSHPVVRDGVAGTQFAVWAPNAAHVSVIGDFNDWRKGQTVLTARGPSGIWEGFVPGVGQGAHYKYHVGSRYHDHRMDKTDPYAFYNEQAPQNASIVWTLDYEWSDREWMDERWHFNRLDAPMSIYELHLGSWQRGENGRFLTYRELADRLTDYLRHTAFTHVEFLPVMEHPYFPSWGYQVTGYFAPTSRYGTPQDFMYLVDRLHQAGVGVILDWVPSHFPTDGHGLGYFDGTHLYEHADPRRGFHPDWKSFIFNYGRNEVRSFLISSALFWLEKYHIDGLRVDAVASMLYLDYSRKQGEWLPNQYGGKENIEAIEFLRRFNQEVYTAHPDVQTIAEESTAWPMVSRPTYIGGLGFGMKWDMGWMHDTLKYMGEEPIHRRYHHDHLTFRMLYAFSENFTLPLSHDEVVHGKGSLLGKMPGDDWQRFANLRLLYGYMYAQPGKKLLFMGDEFAVVPEWDAEKSLEWWVLDFPFHRGMQAWVRELNHVYRAERALHELDNDAAGFEWVDCSDVEHSIVSLLRKGKDDSEVVLGVFNFTPVARYDYRIGVPRAGMWAEVLNSDAHEYAGGGVGNFGGVMATETPAHGRPASVSLTLPPLGALFFKWTGPRP